MISLTRMRRFNYGKLLFRVLIPALCLYVLWGAACFFRVHPTAGNGFAPGGEPYDFVVVFAGDEERIPPAFQALRRGDARRLIISPATPEEMSGWSKRYYHGAPVPYVPETGATSTHDNAARCAEIIRREGAHRIILVTSSYHMNRSYRLLFLALRGYPSEIACFPVFPFGIEDGGTIRRIPYFRTLARIERVNMAFNFMKFMIDGARIRSSNRLEHYFENLYDAFIKSRLSGFAPAKEFPVPPEMMR